MESKEEAVSGERVLATLGSNETARRAAEDLERNGHTPATLLTGEQFRELVDPHGEEAGIIGKIARTVAEHLSEEPNYLMHYQDEANEGRGVVAVNVNSREEADEVGAILVKHGATNMRYFGRLAVSDLTPTTNLSATQQAPEVTHPANTETQG